MNLFGDFFDEKIVKQKPHDKPLYAPLVKDTTSVYVLQVRASSAGVSCVACLSVCHHSRRNCCHSRGRIFA